MKHLILFVLLPVLSYGQMNHREQKKLNEIRYFDEWELNGINNIYFNQKTNHVKEAKVSSITYLNKNKNKAAKVSYKKWYNPTGKIIRMESKTDTVVYNYQDTLLVSIHRKSKKNEYFTSITYDDQHRVSSKSIKKNNQLTMETYYTYFKGQKRTRIERKSYGKKPHTYLLENEYEPILDRITKTTYSVDGILKQTWNYECNEKGKIVDTKLETVNSQCRFEQSNNDGSYSVFTRSIVDGKVQLTETLHSADSTFIGYKSFYNDSVVKYSYMKIGNTEQNKSFNKHGKLIAHSEKEMDAFGNQIAEYKFNKKGERKTRSINTFNEKHLLTSITYEEKYVTLIQYTYF
jgi:hypothetical protein